MNHCQNQLEKCKAELQWLLKIKEQYNLSEENFFVPYKYVKHLQALIQEKEGHLENSEAHFLSLLKMKTQLSYWVTYYHYQYFHTQFVKFLTRNGKWDDALKEVNLCLEYNKNYIPALWEKAFLLEKMENIKQANEVYSLIAELYGKSIEKNQKRILLQKKIKSSKNILP